MPELAILKINEIFWSFQGEGLRAGYPSVFIRLSGCSLKCEYCDTRDAWESGIPMKVSDVIAAILPFRKKYPHSQVVLTGGEPMEQNLEHLAAALKKENFFIAIETNGGIFCDIPVDWWTVSPKDVARYKIHSELESRIDELKLIVNRNLTVDIVRRIRQTGNHFPIFLQPDSSDNHRYSNVFALFEQCQSAGIPDVRPGIQLHKIYKVQ